MIFVLFPSEVEENLRLGLMLCISSLRTQIVKRYSIAFHRWHVVTMMYRFQLEECSHVRVEYVKDAHDDSSSIDPEASRKERKRLVYKGPTLRVPTQSYMRKYIPQRNDHQDQTCEHEQYQNSRQLGKSNPSKLSPQKKPPSPTKSKTQASSTSPPQRKPVPSYMAVTHSYYKKHCNKHEMFYRHDDNSKSSGRRNGDGGTDWNDAPRFNTPDLFTSSESIVYANSSTTLPRQERHHPQEPYYSTYPHTEKQQQQQQQQSRMNVHELELVGNDVLSPPDGYSDEGFLAADGSEIQWLQPGQQWDSGDCNGGDMSVGEEYYFANEIGMLEEQLQTVLTSTERPLSAGNAVSNSDLIFNSFSRSSLRSSVRRPFSAGAMAVGEAPQENLPASLRDSHFRGASTQRRRSNSTPPRYGTVARRRSATVADGSGDGASIGDTNFERRDSLRTDADSVSLSQFRDGITFPDKIVASNDDDDDEDRMYRLPHEAGKDEHSDDPRSAVLGDYDRYPECVGVGICTDDVGPQLSSSGGRVQIVLSRQPQTPALNKLTEQLTRSSQATALGHSDTGSGSGSDVEAVPQPLLPPQYDVPDSESYTESSGQSVESRRRVTAHREREQLQEPVDRGQQEPQQFERADRSDSSSSSSSYSSTSTSNTSSSTLVSMIRYDQESQHIDIDVGRQYDQVLADTSYVHKPVFTAPVKPVYSMAAYLDSKELHGSSCVDSSGSSSCNYIATSESKHEGNYSGDDDKDDKEHPVTQGPTQHPNRVALPGIAGRLAVAPKPLSPVGARSAASSPSFPRSGASSPSPLSPTHSNSSSRSSTPSRLRRADSWIKERAQGTGDDL